MKVEVGSLGVFVDLPNIASWQEAKRISKTLFKYTVETVIPAFPPAYHGRAAKEFVRVFNRDLNHPTKPKKPYQCVKNANAALRQKYKALMNAVNGWRLPLNALYNAQQREGEARNLLLAAQRLIEETGGDMLEFYRIAGEVFINAGIKPVELKKDGSNLYPAAKRLLCKEWIERKIEVSARQHREHGAR